MKLWHKYALALFLAALVPLALATYLLVGDATDELELSTKNMQAAVADIAGSAIDELTRGAMSEAIGIATTLGQQDIPIEDRQRLAQAQLTGAKYLASYSVYNGEGQSLLHMQGADGNRVAESVITAPETLPSVIRDQVTATDPAYYQEVAKAPSGALFLPLTVAILDAKGKAFAYAWTPIEIAQVTDTIAEISNRRFMDDDRVSIVDERLRIIVAPDATRIGQQLAPADVANLSDAEFKRAMAKSFNYTTTSGERRVAIVRAVPEFRWGVVVEQTHDEVYANIDKVTSTAIIIGGAAALLALLLGVWAGRSLSAPITAVSKAAGKVAAGDFTVQVPVAGKDEVGQLGTSFNAMTSQLTSTIEQLKATTAAKERMQTELDIGRNIQMSMVPLTFPAFPERKDFDVHAALKPAFEVGGDFYDFFLTGPDTLCVCIADVSGKGVPAALFMAVTRTLVKTHATLGSSPDEILEKVNDDLAKDNDACMFVTLFLGLLDLKTGVLTYTNAGHNPSYVIRGGSIERLDKLHGPVIAAMEEIPYGSGETKLGKGDTLFLYTDGVNEAMNAKQELFTEERLAGLLAKNAWSTSDGAVKIVLDDVWKFQGAADQADDVTVVALRYLGATA